MKCVFWHKLVIFKYHQSCLNEPTCMRNIFLLLNYGLFSVQFSCLLMVINGKKYKSKYSNTIW